MLDLLFLLLRTLNEVTIIVKRSDPMHDTKISSCKYCQCDIEGHQTWSSPQIHRLKRIQLQRMWKEAQAQVTGLLPFHGLSICTQQSAHCHLKDVTTNLKNNVELYSCIVFFCRSSSHPPRSPTFWKKLPGMSTLPTRQRPRWE